ncbi:MAG: hypothetical protein A3H76_01840 [Candidatus Lloydbacteria bacterium RIFCSPLOWO2_02_FULL_54_12]|nr:MAG: hypothetical protein A3H76_01840 [Candidatus Lloydbacteria bacterium RIFCSPLOWO2_02_FULL_54_12]
MTAQGTYTLKAPFGTLLTGPVELSTYLQGIVQIAIGVAGILAVIMIVVCGIKLMGTPSASGKSEAKECIWNAIFGVLLAIGAWILLYTINPLLLSKELNLANQVAPPAPAAPVGTPVAGTPAGCTGGTPAQPRPTAPGWYFQYCKAGETLGTYNPAGTSGQTCAQLAQAAASTGKTLMPQANGETCFQVLPPGAAPAPIAGGGSEADVRTNLCENPTCLGPNARRVQVSTNPCPSVGSRGCTDVKQLGTQAQQAIIALAGSCPTPCVVIVSGGTEYWLHGSRSTTPPPPSSTAAHSYNNNVFDLRKSSQLDAVIKATGNTQKKSFGNYYRWRHTNAGGTFWYTDEGDHWHACIEGAAASYCQP